MGQGSAPWQELEQTQWLRRPPAASALGRPGVAAQLLDGTVLARAPGRRDRPRAADWALRGASCAELHGLRAPGQLVAPALNAHLSPGRVCGVLEADRLAHVCAMAFSALAAVLDSIVAVGAMASWAHAPTAEDLAWSLRRPGRKSA
ncbi:hypothetical protein AB0D04_13415 [Streptomyces sp. NPDC048483]|uniref:hypothetical protein n=1 Tax=Streptomyces sp. NPDC048483 TaxID=3154927 RepID=UPI00341DF6D1